MGATADAFQEYVEAAAAVGLDSSRYLADGLPGVMVERELAAAGVDADESLIEWFVAANGLRRDASGPALFCGRDLLSLDAAVADRELGVVNDDDEPAIYQPTWMPVIGDHPIVVADTSTGEVLQIDLKSASTTVLAPSLAAWITDEIGSIPQPAEWTEIPLEGHYLLDTTDLDPRSADHMDGLADRLSVEAPRRLRITYPPVGSVSGNGALERVQAERLVERLRNGGMRIAGEVEYVAEAGLADRVVIRLAFAAP